MIWTATGREAMNRLCWKVLMIVKLLERRGAGATTPAGTTVSKEGLAAILGSETEVTAPERQTKGRKANGLWLCVVRTNKAIKFSI